MSLAVVDRVLAQVYARPDLEAMDVLWLTGEPLTLGVDYFEAVIERCLKHAGAHPKPAFIVQTNGTLIDSRWCELFKKHNFVVGVSVDGPPELHNQQRVARGGRHTFDAVERGISLLTENGVRGGAICVITKNTLKIPASQLFDFFHARGIAWSYLLEARIGENQGTAESLSIEDAPRVRVYLSELLELWAKYPESYIRDFEQTARRLFGGSAPAFDPTNLGCLDILNVSADGGFYWGNPELMSASLGELKHLRKNVSSEDIWRFRSSPEFQEYQRQVHSGVALCEATCEFFAGCQGGNPAHKFYEAGRFDISNHTTCRLNDQTIQSLMLEKLQSA